MRASVSLALLLAALPARAQECAATVGGFRPAMTHRAPGVAATLARAEHGVAVDARDIQSLTPLLVRLRHTLGQPTPPDPPPTRAWSPDPENL